jgi:hypothetical protein
VRRFAGNALVNSLVKTDANRPAAHEVWSIETSQLRDIGLALLLYGSFLLVAGFLGGRSRIATSIRRTLAPAFRRHMVAVYATVALVFLVFIAWGPTVASTRIGGIAVLAGLTVLWIEVWRRQTLREFPDTPAVATVGPHNGDREEAARVDTLERLARLRSEGALSETEFQQQKAALLGT